MKAQTLVSGVTASALVAVGIAGAVWWFSPTHQAQLAVINVLNDPDSAKFRNLVVYENGDTVCGEVAAKNGFGAYLGYATFIVRYGAVFDIDNLATGDKPATIACSLTKLKASYPAKEAPTN
jgi:hypothetical protein